MRAENSFELTQIRALISGTKRVPGLAKKEPRVTQIKKADATVARGGFILNHVNSII